MNLLRIRLENESQFSLPTPLHEGKDAPSSKTAAEHENSQGIFGIWECSPGQFQRQVKQAEFSYIITGEGRFIPISGEPITFKTGDSLYFEPHTQGTWEITKTVRKAYFIVK